MDKVISEEEKRANWLEATRRRLEEVALKYARMKTLGIEVNKHDGTITKVSFNSIEDYTRYYLNELGQTAVDLLTELTTNPLPPRKAT